MKSQYSGKSTAVCTADDGLDTSGGNVAKQVLTVGSRMDGAVVITMSGDFDAAAARALLRTMATAASAGVTQVELDLCAVTTSSKDGVRAVTACRRLSEQIPDGVSFRVSGLGRDMLLASVAQDRAPLAMLRGTA